MYAVARDMKRAAGACEIAVGKTRAAEAYETVGEGILLVPFQHAWVDAARTAAETIAR